jgi:hypothetical protein
MANDTSAFPHEHQYTRGQQGMSLRDWFAGQALVGLLAGRRHDIMLTDENFAYSAYRVAQAMLVERQKYESKD